MGKGDKKDSKVAYFLKLAKYFNEYPRCFLVGVDNVGSKQMQQIRQTLREDAVILMGKNTMMRKSIKQQMETNPALEKILPHIRGNVGFVFTREDLVDIRDKILSNKVQAPARAGAIAPLDVKIPPQNTGLGPEKTSFFQALQIPTKISKGTIEIINEIHLIHKDDKVGASEATLLNMLNISPFTYGLKIQQVYDSGTIFNPEILDITSEDLRVKFLQGVRNISAICLQIGYPTVASVPHSIANGLKNLIALAIEADLDLKEAQKAKDYLKNPSAFVSAAPVAATQSKAEEKAKAPEPEEDSEDDDMGLGLFD